MKVSFIVPCRDKAKYVEKTVETVLAQTYSPMEIVLSDQGSMDDTLQIIQRMADNYKGPNKVRILQCPHTEYKGMAGANQHLNWINDQIEGDIVIMCSADDLNHPDRAKYTVEAFEKYNPSYVGTGVQYLNDKYEFNGEVTGFGVRENRDCFVDPVVNIRDLVGSSASSAWAKDLWDKYGPLEGVESQDILLPFFATLERGIFYVNKSLHAYVRHANEDNTGMGGVVLAAEKKMSQLQEELKNGTATEQDVINAGRHRMSIVETNNYHYTSNFFAIIRKVQKMGIMLSEDLQRELFAKAFEGGNIWSLARDNITMARVNPSAMRV